MRWRVGGRFYQVAICALVLEGDVILGKVDDFNQAKALFRTIKS